MHIDKRLLNLNHITPVFALVVNTPGACTRRPHSGPGCPDRPGCYGKLVMRENSRLIKRTGMVLLLTQFSIGAANIVFMLPISIAVLHNGVASLLSACKETLLFHAGTNATYRAAA